MNKQKTRAFGKDIYLLGKGADGVNYWLESPRWECGWYWGFGYIETYTNNTRPDKAKDVSSHQHASDFSPKWWNDEKAILKELVFNDQEGWELAELFKQFYFLKNAAEIFGRGKCNIANTIVDKWNKPGLVKEINEVILPLVMNRIIAILSPE